MASETEILQYLKQNDYLDVYIFLINSADNLKNRGILLKNSIERLEEKIGKALEKVEENPNVDPHDKEMSNYIKDVHYAEFEVIQRLNIMIELLAVYYYLIRTNLRELPKLSGKKIYLPKRFIKNLHILKTKLWKAYGKISNTLMWKAFTNYLQKRRNLSKIFWKSL